ncbi:MAG: helix-turn-helix transcriptional regulator [Patescibacteria group bacterium]
MKKNINKKFNKAIDFQAYLAKQLKKPLVKKYFDEYGKQLEIAYQILQLRKKEGVSQMELARKIGTSQSNIARMERGEQNFTTETLQRIASAFKKELKIEFVS